jgi:hypothetical protein
MEMIKKVLTMILTFHFNQRIWWHICKTDIAYAQAMYCKRVTKPTHEKDRHYITNRQNKMKEGQHITSYIKHLAVSGLSSVSARFKSSCNLTGKCFEMPNVSYT